VAVLDTGIDTDHPDFNSRTFDQTNSKAYVEGTLADQNGHGTHVAGLIAGSPPKLGPVPRYAISPGVDLIVAKVLDKFGNGLDHDVIDALDWAVDSGARIISLSVQTRRARGGSFDVDYETAAMELLRAGVLVIAAAGNESQRPDDVEPVCDPAACPSILSVVAVDQNDNIAPFSCGAVDAIGEVNFAAPGASIYSAGPGGRHFLRSGTSMATPIVAGVAALMLERHFNETGKQMAAADLKKKLETSARPFSPTDTFGSGIVHLGPP
jgi:subtilisin family serine protease